MNRTTATTWTISSPYPGPRPYTWNEADRLFGRDRELADLRNLVCSYRATLLYAQSGAGKSSLVAKLGPALAGKGSDQDTVVMTCRVGACSDPTRENVFVGSALASLTLGDAELLFDHDNPPDEHLTLAAGLVAALKGRDLASEEKAGGWTLARPCLLVIDQIEELFTTNLARWSQRQPFIEQLAAALKATDDLNVLLVIREDYVALLDAYASLLPQGLRIRYRMDRLRKEEAKKAVQGPLANEPIGIELPEAVAETIVTDLLRTKVVEPEGDRVVEIQGEFVEPLHLQVACENLWRVLSAARLVPVSDTKPVPPGHFAFTRQSQHYFASSEVLGDIDTALRVGYDQALKAAARSGGVREGRLRALVRRRLITPNQTRGIVDQATLARDGFEKAIDALIEARIVRREPRSGSPWFELPHDRLLHPIIESNRRFRLARIKILAGVALLFLAFGALVGARKLSRLSEDAGEGKGRATERREMTERFVKVEGALRASPRSADPSMLATDDMTPPQSLEEALKQIPEMRKAIEDLQSKIEKQKETIGEQDETIRKLRATLPQPRPLGDQRPVRPIASAALAPVKPLTHADIKPNVEAREVEGKPGIYDFSLSLRIPAEQRESVRKVTYTFNHPTFKHKARSPKPSEKDFRVGYQGWGCLTDVGVTLDLTDGGQVPLNIDMCKLLGW